MTRLRQSIFILLFALVTKTNGLPNERRPRLSLGDAPAVKLHVTLKRKSLHSVQALALEGHMELDCWCIPQRESLEKIHALMKRFSTLKRKSLH
ncbi:hypothetical protein PF008_g23464 [Phytophthora fragariae]|uniref:RxLR effector protein n=1 Tax=Phytophthora fragariae TaxID=53985 RepID=A0A6G0QQN4_9STRA|nr:hypothetical protein PF008_g23464 [Phytophthora fragariae]